MSVYIKDMKMPTSCYGNCPFFTQIPPGEDHGLINYCCLENWKQPRTPMPFSVEEAKHGRQDFCPLIHVPPHGRLIDADALTGQMERNLWAIEDKAEKELGFDETLRRGMQYGHAVCLNAVNDATVVFVPQIVRCCECEYNNHCLTQEFVKEESKMPFDENTWFCADAKAAPIIPAEEGEG